jgi:uncharacterized protein with NRDE domain
VSKNGRLAALTNFQEPSSKLAVGEKSRGTMITSFLTSPEPVSTPTKAWIHKVIETGEMKGVGGFIMVCGTLKPSCNNLEELAVISNRTCARDDGLENAAHWVCGRKAETYGLSNSLLEKPWPKVKLGEQLLSETLRDAAENEESEDQILERCFAVLRHDTLPDFDADDTYETEINALMHSIFIPVFNASEETTVKETTQSPEPPAVPGDNSAGQQPHVETLEVDTAAASSNQVDHLVTTPLTLDQWRKSPRLYGTAQQTVILVNKHGHLKYVERTLYDNQAQPIDKKEGTVLTEFDIEGWSHSEIS